MQSPEATQPFLTPIVEGPKRLFLWASISVWLAATAWFWVWWFDPAHIDSTWRFVLLSGLLGWLTFLQCYFVYFAMRGVRASAPDPVAGRFRVAMIVTKTPSEPFALIQNTLEAMLKQNFPHDTWLADEDPNDATKTWCAQHGVQISSRKGVEAYHQATWPRRTRCKEGNLAYFYDHWGYEDYDIVSQLDSDHVPQPGYLKEILRPFADDKIGYVSAPSICSSNSVRNWAVRTRLHTEGAFHGILQAGYSNGCAPMCIGSHYAVRTKALREAGGLGPELAEDHSTTMLMNAAGWRGVHAVDAIAIGDGPATVADLAIQEFQWSRSLVTLLLVHTPHYLKKLPFWLKAQFLFCQVLYPIFGITFLMMYLLPIAAVLLDIRYAEVTFPQYLAHAAPQILALLVFATTLQRLGLFRPTDAPVISWERTLFLLLQWPWVLWGCISAARDSLTGRFVDFRITPKGETGPVQLPYKVWVVYLVLAMGCIIPVLAVDDLENAQGFYLLTLVSGLLYTLTVTIIVVRHMHENGWPFVLQMRDVAVQFTAVAVTIALLVGAFTSRSIESIYALTIGLEPVSVVTLQTNVAGAGSASREPFTYEFNLDWGFLPPLTPTSN
ncbi:glycosyltransferase family 2 protein [uncultured Litoreibacter sp.]|uniref:glycosyltransferase family 2 protein n=1 Tax=uncultured Litoreibacter sp. TaxID=1392394 RepID=UPI0026138FF5|nr:glycosyltransferase family 2 protein [uncultured Litoreibacter sp.]